MGNCLLICPPVNDGIKSNPKRSHGFTETEKSGSNVSSVRKNLIFTPMNRGDIKKYYDKVKLLGEGSMGSVALVQKKENFVGGSAYTTSKKGWFGRDVKVRSKAPTIVVKEGQRKMYALKSIILSRVSREFLDELRNEIAILQTLNHPNIVKAYEVYETGENIYMVLEHCSGGDLYCRIPYSEKESAKIIGKLLSAISYMHMHGITHRDLKFENILFESPHPDAEIKLIDFGLSKKVEGETKHMTEGVGTIYTMAPQVLRGVYTSKADLWSIGVITYMLLSNTKPFHGRKRSQVMRMILKGKYSFDSRRWNHVSNEAMDFVSQLLIVNEDERIDADEALNHEWQSKQFNLSERTPDIALMNTVQESIVNYGAMGEFKKMALMVIAHKSTTDEILALRRAFDAFDTSNNGTISIEEFKDTMKKVKNQISDEEVENIFNSIDVGADGEIHYLEFLAATLEAHGRITEERLAEAFDRIDSDDSGVISKQNLRELLGTDYSDKKIDEMLKEVDMNNDGGITFDEFREIFRAEQVKEEKRLMPISSHDLGSSFGE